MPWSGSTWVDHEVAGGNTDFTGILQYSNAVTGDAFGLMLLVSVFIVIFIGSSARGQGESGLASSLFITTLLSYMLAAMDVVGDWVAVAFTVGLVASMVILYRGGGEGGV